MKGTTQFMQSMDRANKAIRALGDMGFVVIGMKCGNYNPVITIEPPKDKNVLDKAPVIAVQGVLTKGCVQVQVARFDDCLIEWAAPQDKSNKFYKSPDLADPELADYVASTEGLGGYL